MFKAKVCQLVVSNIASLVDLSGTRRLVVDYQGFPIEFTSEDTQPQPRTGHHIHLGESDVKFTQYLDPGMPFLADSVDGGTVYPPQSFAHTATA